jgi:hypothetical protein
MLRLSVSSLSPQEVGDACAHVVFVFVAVPRARVIGKGAGAWQPIVAAPPVDLFEFLSAFLLLQFTCNVTGSWMGACYLPRWSSRLTSSQIGALCNR